MLAPILRPAGQAGHHVAVSCRGGQQQQAAEVVCLREALLREAELALASSELGQLLPLLFRLRVRLNITYFKLNIISLKIEHNSFQILKFRFSKKNKPT